MKNLLNFVNRRNAFTFSTILLVSFVFVIFTLNSCQREEEKIKEFSNPYKDLGVLHNKILEEAVKNSDAKLFNSKLSHKEVVETIMQSSKKVYTNEGIAFDLLNIKGSDSLMNFIEIVNLDLYKYNESAYLLNYYPINVKDKIDEFITLISENSNLDINDSYCFINNFELSIFNDNSFREEDKQTIFKFTATYRESIKFWYSNKDLLNLNNKGWLSIVAFGVADAIGAAGGPVICALGSYAFWVSVMVAEGDI